MPVSTIKDNKISHVEQKIGYKEQFHNNSIMLKSRKVTEEDLFGQQTKYKPVIYTATNELPKYKNEEHGAKKRIKPWRTGVKSQQQPPKSGFSKNLR